MKPLLGAFLAVILLAGSSVAAKPNVIFILSDDQGYGDLGRHGHPILKTPNLDRLYDQSVRFDRFYVSPSCSPTRAALMTGMHEFRNGVTHTILPREHLNKDATILPQLLKTAGYRTCFIGKWHLGGGEGYSPQFRGFDWCTTSQGGARKHFDPDIIRNGERLKREGFREDLYFDEAMAFIDDTKDQPFFCYLATFSPHTPLAAPEVFIAPYREAVGEEKATYLGMVANIDYNVGRLMGFLDKRKLSDNTILIYMNDNGQTKGLDVYNAGMRGCKCTIWEGGSRAMSLWRWPGRWPSHTVENLTAHLDVLPTLCDLAGVDVPKALQPKLEGFSLRRLLESAEPASWHEDRMLFQHVARWPSGQAASHKYVMCAVRQGSHVLLRSRPCDNPDCTPKVKGNQCNTLRNVEQGETKAVYTEENAQFHWGVSPKGQWALFDVAADPACRQDSAARKPELVSRLASAYDRWWDGVYPQMIEAGGDGPRSDEVGEVVADPRLQLAENPPMETISRKPPAPVIPETFDVRDGFVLVETLDDFRAATKRDGQKVRVKPGVYRFTKGDPPMEVPMLHAAPGKDGAIPMNRQQHIIAVNGSNNYFDLRGVVFETPTSLQSTFTQKAHVFDCWHINGANNTFEGGYFRNVVDMDYPKFRVAENEFEICNDGNTFLDCTFDISGSVPYGYSDYYGKGGPNFGRLNKHSFMSLQNANDTTISGCRIYMRSFGHCLHFHKVDGVRIENCLISGTLRPTNDIFKEAVGRAKEYDFNIMYRGKRPIPRDEVIPLTEDAVRSYNEVKNVTVTDTTVERQRGCFQLLCIGDVTLENVTVREAGDFYYDLSSGSKGKVVMKNCRADLAYNPVFNLTRGDVPKNAFYEVTILSPAEGVKPTPRTGLGVICGDGSTFILHDGTTGPVPEEHFRLKCGGRKPLVNSTVTNYTTATLILEKNVRNCTIRTAGEIEDRGEGNTIIRIEPLKASLSTGNGTR